jgi:hypothetical protein
MRWAGVSNPTSRRHYKVAINRNQNPAIIYSQQRLMFNDDGEPAGSKKRPAFAGLFLKDRSIA